MLRSLRLVNFRGFEDHLLPFRPVTVIVGKNNAGKSTIIEALTLVSLVSKRYHSLPFRESPYWLQHSGMGVYPSVKDLDIILDGSVFHRYRKPPASIEAVFTSGELVRIHVGPDSEIFAEMFTGQGHPIWSKAQAKKAGLPSASVLPPIGPLAQEEKYLSERHVIKHYMSSLGSLHFRNQLDMDEATFDEFRQLAEISWDGLHIHDAEFIDSDNKYVLMVQDGDFVAEVGWMGHGLQMWLQVMWFLARNKHAATVVLDEPDVYMHPDLQRRLVRLVRNRHTQSIIATHSIEIMSEVNPDEILVVDRLQSESVFAGSVPAVQTVIQELGGLHNLQASRLTTSSRFLVVEGQDRDFLREFYYCSLSEAAEPFDSIPFAETGGWGNWKYAVGSAKALHKTNGESVTTYCILDRDYHADSEIRKRYAEAKEHKVQLHVWKRKEIENYLLIPELICRVVAGRLPSGKEPPSPKTIAEDLDGIAESMKVEVFDAMAQELHAEDRNRGVSGANQKARGILDEYWKSREGRLCVVGGKEVISRLSALSKAKYGVSFSAKNLAQAIQRSELADEVVHVMTALANGLPLQNNGLGDEKQ